MPTLNLEFPLEQGEDNIVTRLKERLAYYELAVPTVLPLGTTNDEDILRAIKRGPAIFPVFESDYSTAHESDLIGDVQQKIWRAWRVLIVCTSMRGEPAAARRGPLGAYRLSDAVIQFLVGFDPYTNSDEVQDRPMYFVSRMNAPSEDLADYMMVLRFMHEVDVNPNELGE